MQICVMYGVSTGHMLGSVLFFFSLWKESMLGLVMDEQGGSWIKHADRWHRRDIDDNMDVLCI